MVCLHVCSTCCFILHVSVRVCVCVRVSGCKHVSVFLFSQVSGVHAKLLKIRIRLEIFFFLSTKIPLSTESVNIFSCGAKT